jgi:hypothetical protein
MVAFFVSIVKLFFAPDRATARPSGTGSTQMALESRAARQIAPDRNNSHTRSVLWTLPNGALRILEVGA